ncbi:MAG TPA: hypothetical protein VGM97_08160 [Steroidobacteraceae bacterium]
MRNLRAPRLLLVVALGASCLAHAAAPVLLRTANHESPVRGGPGELLLIQGSGLQRGDRVVYQAADVPTATTHPASVPLTSSAAMGLATVVKLADPPYALTVRLPEVLTAGRPYRLWVVDPQGQWSAAVSINDPRPLWISPAAVYASLDPDGAGRVIRIVGRNLRYPAQPHDSVLVRLRGPDTYELTVPPRATDAALADFVRDAALPRRLIPGRYSVSLSTDGRHWLEVPDQTLTVSPDPVALPKYALSDPRFGACRPDDGADDSACLARALEQARAAGGAVITLAPGTWDVNSGQLRDGFILAPNVGLEGSDQRTTIVRRHGAKQAPMPGALLTLTGRNKLTGITFIDDEHYVSASDSRTIVQLGLPPVAAGSADAETAGVDDVRISHDTFSHVGRALLSGGRPLHRLIVTHDSFGAFETALMLTGGGSDPAHPYDLEDSIFRDNHFVPGSYLDIAARQGTVASQIGASHRVDFSDNTADGSASSGLQRADDPGGWRAAFFWSLANNNEELLIAANRIDCSGDKAGDGEAVALDNSGGSFAFDGVQEVDDAGPDWVSVRAPLLRARDGRSLPAAYFVGQWVTLVDGAGLGQTRRIRDYSEDSIQGTVRLRVAPQWDVVPQRGHSRVSVMRQYWQVYIIANRINHASPPCRKSNLNGPHGGAISLWTSIADSVVSGNEQTQTDGIGFLQAHSAHTAAIVTALEIRHNIIDGEYDWSSDCSWSGIRGYFVATATPQSPPPWLGFGIVISNNEITHADGQRGGAIQLASAGPSGPPPGTWPLSENILIYGNTIRDIDGPAPRPLCAQHQSFRSGIRIEGHRNVRDTVLEGNICEAVTVPLQDAGTATTRVCPAAHSASCECAQP